MLATVHTQRAVRQRVLSSLSRRPCRHELFRQHYQLLVPRCVRVAMLIARPPCPKCGATMMLARIAADGTGFELRSFECPNCEHTFAELVAGTDQRAATLPNSALCGIGRNARRA